MVHILELVRPSRQNVSKANLNFRTDAFDTGSHKESPTNRLLATVTAARRRKEHVRLERGDITLDIARKTLSKAIKRARRHMRHRLDAIAKTYTQIHRGLRSRNRQK